MALSELYTCFSDLVGINKCPDDPEPSSGLYVNDLPGMTVELVQLITQKEDETYIETWNKAYKRAVLSFRTSFLAQVNKCYKINDPGVIDCLLCESKDTLAIAFQIFLGYTILNYAKGTWRINQIARIGSDQIDELSAMYFTDFSKELEAAVYGIDIVNSDCIPKPSCCIQSNGTISQQYVRM